MNNNNINTVHTTKTRCLVQVALLIALEIIFSRFLSISTPIVKISFSFLPIAAIAILYGPVYAGIGAAIADFIGAILFPAGTFFPGFTLTAGLVGTIYGLFLYKKQISFFRIICAVLIINIILQLGLDTLWLTIITGNKYVALIPIRAVKCIAMIPVQVVGIKSLNILLQLVRRVIPVC